MDKIKSSSFLRGTVLLSLSVVITKIIGVAFKVPLSYILGDVGMGYFNTAYAIYGFFYILCTAGVPKSVTLILTGHGALCTTEGDKHFVLNRALRLFLIVGAIATLINLTCAPALARLVGNRQSLLSIIAVAPSIVFVSASGVLRGYLNSCERLSAIAISQLIEGVIKLIFGLLLAILGVKISASLSIVSALAISGITLGSMVSLSYLLIMYYNYNTDDNTRQKHGIDLRNIRWAILKRALPIAICSSVLNLSSVLDLTMIIKRLTDVGESEIQANALYGNYTTLAVPMFTLVVSVLYPVATSYMPRLSTFAVNGDVKNFESYLSKLLCITLLITVPASMAFYFYSFDLLDVLFSVNSSAVGADMLICLSLGLGSLTVLNVANTALESQGRIKITVASLLVGALTKFAVSYLLIGKSGIGILGAPLGTVASYTVSLAVSLFALEISGIRTRVVRMMALTYVIGTVSFLLPYKAVYSSGLTTRSSFLAMIISLAISCSIYVLLLCVWYLIFNRCECLLCTKKNTLRYEIGRFFGKCDEKGCNF